MSETAKFRVQAGALLFEMEGPRAFVEAQILRRRDEIETLLREQARIIRSGQTLAAPAPAAPKRRGRPPKAGSAPKAPRGRRPGRQTVIIRDSKLSLKESQLKEMRESISAFAKGGKLGKDATVFAIAYYLCANVLGGDRFTAGDVIAAYKQMGSTPSAPSAGAVDVVQMLRNLAATSIGKVWVERNLDGSFSLTAKGKEVGKTGQIVRPRGRRPNADAAPKEKIGKRRGRKPGVKSGRKPGRPAKTVAIADAAPKRRGRPPKNPLAAAATAMPRRKPGRPRKNAAVDAAPRRKPGRPPKAVTAAAAPKRRGRPPKNAAMSMLAASATPVRRKPGRPAKAAVAAAPKRRGRPPKNAASASPAASPNPVRRGPGRPRKI